MCAGATKYDVRVGGVPDQKPIRFDVALPVPSILAGKSVCVAAGRQGIFTREHRHDPIQFRNFLAPPFHELPIAFELRGRCGAEHKSHAGVELRNQILDRLRPSQVTPAFGITHRPPSRPIRQLHQER